MSQFEQIFVTNIKREGSAELLNYLKSSDFFTAPASARYHLNVEGGLCTHSVNVYNRLLGLVKAEYGDNYREVYTDESIAICGLLHDVCKVNYYVVDYRNVKEDGQWIKKPYYTVSEKFPFGHGEKSVFLVNQYIKLSADEAQAINWHMGGFDQRVQGGSFSVSEAYCKYKLAVLTHVADLQATYLDEERGAK